MSSCQGPLATLNPNFRLRQPYYLDMADLDMSLVSTRKIPQPDLKEPLTHRKLVLESSDWQG